MKILVTGAGGQLAQSIKEISKNYKNFDFDFLTKEDLNLIDFENLIKQTANNKYDVVINCAAYTNVEYSTTAPGNALKGNSKIVKNLAKVSKINNFFIVHFSTDYVFDGKKRTPYNEDDDKNPINYYGATKLLGENNLINFSNNACIIRTSWLYSSYGNNFVKNIIKKAKENESINVVNDQMGSPTYAPDLAKVVLDILPKIMKKEGVNIYHYCNKDYTNWFNFAKTIINYANLKCLVKPIATHELKSGILRPFYSVLDTSKIVDEFNISIPKWQDSLKECIAILLKK